MDRSTETREPSERATVTAAAPAQAIVPGGGGIRLPVRPGWRPRVRIHRPARPATQSGRAKSRHWVIEFEPLAPPEADPLVGWIGSDDTLQQVRLRFSRREQAIAFAERQGWACTVYQPRERIVRPKSYAANFIQPERPGEPAPRWYPAAGGRPDQPEPEPAPPAADEPDPIDEAGDDSFPASDPPGWGPDTGVGKPRPKEKETTPDTDPAPSAGGAPGPGGAPQ